jgi:4'-phosphopantetheinyl transferase
MALHPPAPGLLPLPPGEVHVWLVEPEAISEPRLLSAYAELLDAEESARQRRFHFPRHQRQYLVSHALVRLTLSRYAPVAPAAWSFVTNAYGRPEVRGEGHAWLRFNLSHTEGMALCAVTAGEDLGADVEDASRPGQTVELADHFFAPAEAAALRALPPERQRERFFEYWTLKEAYIKARGMGLSLSLQQFAFALEAGQPPRIRCDPALGDDAPEAWRFVQLRPSARHQAALAVRRAGGAPLTVRCWRTVPLASEEALPLSLLLQGP